MAATEAEYSRRHPPWRGQRHRCRPDYAAAGRLGSQVWLELEKLLADLEMAAAGRSDR